jgi:hypothetical protein
LRLLRIGVQVEFDRMQRESAPAAPGQQEKAKPNEWLVRLSFPRRLLDQNEKTDLEVYDDDVNPDDVESAKDTGLDDESSLHADEQLPADGMPQDPTAMPPQENIQPKPPAP